MVKSTGLGFAPNGQNSNRQGEMSRQRPIVGTSASATAVTAIAPCRKYARGIPSCSMKVPKGFLPLALYSSLFVLVPLLYYFVSFDYSSTAVRTSVIVTSAVLPFVALLANDPVVWFNLILFLHIGIEVGVLDTLMDFARASTSSDRDSALAYTAVGVIIAHLAPFVLVDNVMFLMVLAYAGVVVNASALVFVDNTQLLLVGTSSVTLLLTTMFTCCVCEVRCSMLNRFLCAMKDGSWLVLSNYQ